MKFKTKELSDQDIEIFNAIRDKDYSNIALMSALYKGKDVACICSIHKQDNSKEVYIQPLAILTSEFIRKDLLCSSGQKLK